MATTINLKVNKEIYDKFNAICDSKQLLSSIEITDNFIDAVVLRALAGVVSQDHKYIDYNSELGEKFKGDYELKDLYLPSGFRYDTSMTLIKYKGPDDDPFGDYFRGCLVDEINTQYKRFCKRNRKR